MSANLYPPQRRYSSIIPWLLGAGVFLLVASTISHYGLTWDEPNYFHASDLEIRWFYELANEIMGGDPGSILSDEKIQSAWHWDPYHVPHPPFSRILSGMTKAIFSPFMDKFVAYRLAPALFFALLVVVMYMWMAALFDRMTGLVSALTLVLIPNLFAFAHFAVTDMPLAAMWFLTVYCFWRGLKSWRWSLALGVAWGFALSTKFPAFLIPIPLLLWAHLFHRNAYTNNVFAMSFISPLFMIASQPYLWHRTPTRIVEFLYDSVSRGYRHETNFTIFFFDRLYFTSELPWYYPFFITAITTPEVFLALLCVGVASVRWLKARREVPVLFLFNALFILVIGLFPGAVLHDGIRQLLPVLPFLGGLAGSGFFALTEYLMGQSQKIMALKRIKHPRAKLTGILSLLVLFPPGLDLLVYHPYELSYYNRLVRGIRGAYQRGLEVTYFMEAFTPDFLDLLNRTLPPRAVINAGVSNFMFSYYQQEGRLRRDIRITEGEDFQYLVLLNRRSTFGEDTHTLVKTVPPHNALRLDGVPLVLIYRK
ncbi:MAG: ArnT family glycosyltransferase [Candidatus Binatia bacterium]